MATLANRSKADTKGIPRDAINRFDQLEAGHSEWECNLEVR